MTDTPSCPICHRTLSGSQPRDVDLGPFCSRRCKLADLGNWLDGRYLVAEPLSDLVAEPLSDLEGVNGQNGGGSTHE